MEIKNITNIRTVGEMKEFLKNIPDSIELRVLDNASGHSHPLALQWWNDRFFMVTDEVNEQGTWYRFNVHDVEIPDVKQ